MIKIISLNKNFGKFNALRDVNLKIKKGEIFGLLGPNGAGKTTLISILSTLVKYDSGEINVAGFDLKKNPQKIREVIGVIFQKNTLDEDLTVYQNLDIHSRFYIYKNEDREKTIGKLLELLDLKEVSHKKLEFLSGGMKRKVEIARGLINNPKILFLDEPTLGLDPKIRKIIWDYIKKLNKERKITFILSTNYLEEAEKLCERICIIDKGRIKAIIKPKNIKKRLRNKLKPTLYHFFMEHIK